MAEPTAITRTIELLSDDLRPVKPIASPVRRAMAWLGVILALALILACVADDHALADRLMAVPDLWLAVLGSALTTLLSGLAAFHLSVPGRSPWWALLPLPGLALWIGASGFGCLRTWIVPGIQDASLAESRTCFMFIVLVSVPLSALMLVMLRRGFPLYPNLTALTAGLGVAAAAATLLNFFHPYDASATDLLVHLAAVALVVGLNKAAVRVLPGYSMLP